MVIESDLSKTKVPSPFQSFPSNDNEEISQNNGTIPIPRPWSYTPSPPRLQNSLTTPTSPGLRKNLTRYQEADIGDTPRLFSIRKQPSSTFSDAPYSGNSAFGKSNSEPNFFEDKMPQVPPTRPGSTAPGLQGRETAVAANDLDITENGVDDAMLKLEPDDLARFRRWVIGFCIVNFDLEVGQALDYVYPPMELTAIEKKNICFSAFPDSNVFEVGDQVYNVRVRASTTGLAASGPTNSAGFLYGYVFFRQKKDARIRRGYFQHPFVGLFSRLVAILGPVFFDTGQPMLEAACMNIVNWGPALEGKVLDLPFLGNLLQVEISRPFEPQLLETTSFDMNHLQPDVQIMASLPTGGLYHHFKDILQDLWLLWELMLLGEPLIVMAPEPGICSEAVVSLVNLINPIPYCGDYRPYFTIQDSDFKSFVTKKKPPSNLVLGVTNPFFNTAVEHWPHIVRVGRQQLRRPDGTLMNDHGKHVAHKSKAGKGNIMFDFVQGVTSKRKSVIAKDRKLLKMLTEANMRGHPPDWVLNNILRRHFVDLTEKFLAPLNSYFSTIIPDKTVFQTDVGPPQLRPFQTEQFMKFLKEHGAQLPFKTTFKTRTSATDPTKDLYSQFLKCGNFAMWLQQRTTEAQWEMNKQYIEVLCDGDSTRSSADLKTRIRDLLYPSSSMSSGITVTDEQREQLRRVLGEGN
ncbi:hypothetical protein BX666DRAFT_2027704 [Dichotomocladium elegans]|nr:hypothetical protein BX666DRAFT_2027704 [Dichotomocladium elegans]